MAYLDIEPVYPSNILHWLKASFF